MSWSVLQVSALNFKKTTGHTGSDYLVYAAELETEETPEAAIAVIQPRSQRHWEEEETEPRYFIVQLADESKVRPSYFCERGEVHDYGDPCTECEEVHEPIWFWKEGENISFSYND